jgi:uncharacterized protein (TIGR03492 family)
MGEVGGKGEKGNYDKTFPITHYPMKKLLCLSNGHGEDAIAIRILRQLQHHPDSPKLAALPIVGEGQAYIQQGIPLIGTAKIMPSGGFVYMDGQQLWRDLQGGLLQLLWKQFKIVRAWGKQGGAVLAVGDIVPLLLAWLSGANYAFVGTAKSEYYLRDEASVLPRSSWWDDRLQIWSGSVYYPWERWLMSHPRCKAVFPRDPLTAKRLQQWPIPAFDMGNPMMDDLEPGISPPRFYGLEAIKQEQARSLTITLLPGSRAPEVYANWQLILEAVSGLIETFWGQSVLFLGAIAPSLSLDPLRQSLEAQGWRQSTEGTEFKGPISDPTAIIFTQQKATLILTQKAFGDCLHSSDLAIAMAGTATEQFVGLGKPAIAIPGSGPQFNPTFAEAQSRLLGPSLIVVNRPQEVALVIQSLLRDPDRLQLIVENGTRRMGKPGAARRIANCLMEKLVIR